MQLRQLMGHLKLEVNEEKTRTCRIPDESFDFLGYTFGRNYSPKTGTAYVSMRPSKKSITRVIDKVRAQTERRMSFLDAAQTGRRHEILSESRVQQICLLGGGGIEPDADTAGVV
jgi:hypothetical protein